MDLRRQTKLNRYKRRHYKLMKNYSRARTHGANVWPKQQFRLLEQGACSQLGEIPSDTSAQLHRFIFGRCAPFLAAVERQRNTVRAHRN
jgi:hypothetical protein